jgi:protein TonB
MNVTSPRFVAGLLTAILLHAAVLVGWQLEPQTPLQMPSQLILNFSPMAAGPTASAMPSTPRQPDPTETTQPEAAPVAAAPREQRPTLARAEPESARPAELARAVAKPESHSAPDQAGAGAAAAAVRVRYEQALAAWLDQHKYYPASLRRRGLEGEGVLRVRLARDGHVLTLETFSALPDPLLERVARDWVRRADPFPAVPQEVAGMDYSVRFPVRFRLD